MFIYRQFSQKILCFAHLLFYREIGLNITALLMKDEP